LATLATGLVIYLWHLQERVHELEDDRARLHREIAELCEERDAWRREALLPPATNMRALAELCGCGAREMVESHLS
jgi:hypothetical protein